MTPASLSSFCSLVLKLFVFSILFSVQFASKRHKAKIVHQPSSYGFRQHQPVHLLDEASAALVSRRSPAPVAGPKALEALKGKCFKMDKDDYEWKLCPFDNATQTESGMRWNPYHGVLGIWDGWAVDVMNNSFVGMEMSDGDQCGHHGKRSVLVRLSCGASPSLSSVSEPRTCHYAMTLTSAFACRPRNQLVYPSLNQTWKSQWDRIKTQFQAGVLTQKGYVRSVQKMLGKVGLVSSRRDGVQSTRNSTSKVDVCDVKKMHQLEKDLAEARVEMQRLRRELRRLVATKASLRPRTDGTDPSDEPHTSSRRTLNRNSTIV